MIQINTAVMRTSGKWRETQQVNRRVSQRRLYSARFASYVFYKSDTNQLHLFENSNLDVTGIGPILNNRLRPTSGQKVDHDKFVWGGKTRSRPIYNTD